MGNITDRVLRLLSGDPTAALGAATKQYVDTRVLKSGDTMTGPLVLPANATLALQAVPLQQLQAVIPPDYISGLKMAWVSNTSISVSSGAAVLASTGSLLTNAGTLTLSPSLVASKFYHVYLYNNAGTPAIEAVMTNPSATYFGNARSQTGDTSRRYVGSILTDASANIINFQHTSDDFICYQIDTRNAPTRCLSGGTSAASTVVSVASAVPITTQTAKLNFLNTDSSAAVILGNSLAGGIIHVIRPIAGVFGTFPLNASQQLTYYFSAAPTTGQAYIDVLGYCLQR